MSDIQIPPAVTVMAATSRLIDLQHSRGAAVYVPDTEGLRIYIRLKKIVQGLTLSALYEPMIQAAKDSSTSHPYVKAAAKNTQHKRTIETEDCVLSVLVLACKSRSVDQEQVSLDDIVCLAMSRME